MNNGDGLRVVLWLSGCNHHCKGCQNKQTWDIDSGIQFNESAKIELFEKLSEDYISGITFSGGDPLHENNINEVLNLITEIRNRFPSKNIWLYTGYTWNQIFCPIVTDDFNLIRDEIINSRRKIVEMCDVLVDGKYIELLRDLSAHWVGSKNQKVINVKKSLESRDIVLWENVNTN